MAPQRTDYEQASGPSEPEVANVDVPAVDQDVLSIFQLHSGDGAIEALAPQASPRPFREGVYASTKGARLVNDGIGYGEVTVERFRCVCDGKFVEITRRSVRTRTGRQTLQEKVEK